VGKTGFTRVRPEETGVFFTNVLSEALGLTNSIVNNGAGLAAGDIDGDGLCDLYFCSLEGGNRLSGPMWTATAVLICSSTPLAAGPGCL
jgi:hypothetical protein